MSSKAKTERHTSAAGRRELKEIIDTCEAISERKFNPFFLDVKLGVETLRQYYPKWETFDEHCLDAHALNRLSEVVRLQNTQLKFQSSALYADPTFLTRKLEHMSEKRLADVFLQSWHPITELEHLTEETVNESLTYWNALLPISERWLRRAQQEARKPVLGTSDTLTELGISGERFDEQLTGLWKELRNVYESSGQKPVDYWQFVRRPTYHDTVLRAYNVSFLITYGYATLQHEADKLSIIPANEPSGKPTVGGSSYPIPIPKED
jgi:hypothetical protein